MCNSNKNNILIICRDLQSVRRLSSFNSKAHSRYILASDDPRVHKAVKKYSWIDKICWIEKMESFYYVADDVIRFRKIINEWLKSLANEKRGVSEELLFFTRIVEGGMTTQRIQDLLLLIRSYHFLLDTYNIISIIVISQPYMGWEDDILIETARVRRIHINIIGHYRTNVLYSNIRQYLEIYGRGLYYLFNFLRVKIDKFYRYKPTKNSYKEVLFQLCSSAQKHVKNIVSIMRVLKHKGYKPIALCWSVTERYTKPNSSKKIRAEGLDAEELEKSAPFSCIFPAFLGVLSTWWTAKARYQEFLSLTFLQYKSVPLGHSLWPSVRFFLLAKLMPRYIFNTSIKNYLDNHNPMGIKIWNEGVAPEGYLLLNNLSENTKPLIFYWNWVPVESPYDPENQAIDLYLAAGNWHKEYFKKRGVSSDKIALVGMSQFDNIIEFKNKNSRDKSFVTIGIPSTFSRYILYDSNVVMRGYMSNSEQVVTLSALLKFASMQPSVALLIKPHPGHHQGIVEEMIKHGNDLKNVFLINKNMLPYHALNVADLLITKFSTLGIESMIFEKPVISVILDLEKRWKIYQDAATYVFDVEKMHELLKKIALSDGFFLKWKKSQIGKQKEFFKSYLNFDSDCKDRLDSSELAAAAIVKCLLSKSKEESYG